MRESLFAPAETTIRNRFRSLGKRAECCFDGAKIFDDEVKVVAEVVRNKKNPALWGLKNLTESDWRCVLPNGAEKTVPAGSAAPIFTGTSITVGEEKFEIED